MARTPVPQSLPTPGGELVRELLAWRPAMGVLSLYLDLDPADRSAPWRTKVRNDLGEIVGAGTSSDRDTGLALEATAGRLGEFLAGEERVGNQARALIGFVEVLREPGEARWYRAGMPLGPTLVSHGPSALVHPLLELFDDGAPHGVAAVTSERIRLLDWRLGDAEQLHDWPLEYFAGDWRERKGPRMGDRSSGQAVTSSGRDQHAQRLEDTRERFCAQAGALARGEAAGRGWRQLLAFGDERYVRAFESGFGDGGSIRHLSTADLISEPVATIERLLDRALPELNRERERSLIARVTEAAYAEGRSALGPQETMQALREGRVEHLVYDAGREYLDLAAAAAPAPPADSPPAIERAIELALSTGAAVTPVEGASARELDERGGMIALLRY